MPELHEEAVTCVVTYAVVEDLEPVEVEEEHRRASASVAALGDLAEPLDEQVTVRQSGERVMRRLVTQPSVGRVPFERDRRQRSRPREDALLDQLRMPEIGKQHPDAAQH